MSTREIKVRGFKRGVLVFEETLVVENELAIDRVAGAASERHWALIESGAVGMIELEFTGAPVEARFFRIGTETEGMVDPVEIALSQPPEPLCHCGQPLHYTDPANRRMVEALVSALGENMPLTVGGRTWLVQRHYIALHGVNALELPFLGFTEVTGE